MERCIFSWLRSDNDMCALEEMERLDAKVRFCAILEGWGMSASQLAVCFNVDIDN